VTAVGRADALSWRVVMRGGGGHGGGLAWQGPVERRRGWGLGRTPIEQFDALLVLCGMRAKTPLQLYWGLFLVVSPRLVGRKGRMMRMMMM
jgi:hypothetical protein